MRRFALVLSLFAMPILASCGGSSSNDYGTNPPPPPQAGIVQVWTNYYAPVADTITAGQTVTWTWATAYGVDHDVVFDDGSVNSGVKTSGTFAHTFSTAGTYTYHCTRHPMTGTVVVR